MIRAVVFDLWNTLIHSRGGDPFRHLKAMMTPEQAEHYSAFRLDAMAHVHASAHHFLNDWRTPLALSDEQFSRMANVFGHSAQDAEAFPDTPKALLECQKLARLALLSNTQSFDIEFLQHMEALLPIGKRFLSAELGLLKPDTALFDHVAKSMHLFPGELAMVGDSWTDDVQGGLAAGWTVFWLNRTQRPRPALPENLDDEFLIEIHSLSQLPEALENLQAGARCSTCLG